ncbi:MAG: ATP-binding protein [Bacteroidetes bacterium]|nr:ATP-binding protein [Bacteroidota bacterium]MBS1944753.1 ATP-binding protein [Bacteroidota bacterium]
MPSPLKPRIVFPQAMAALKRSPALGILGARQVGKSTLARQLAKAAKRKVLFLDLESPADLDRLREPEAFLWRHRDRLIVIDEVQRMPELFPVLRSLIDRDRRPSRFLLLGSSSPELIRRSSESLAGRISYMDLFPFCIRELRASERDRLWLRGGYPRAFLARSHADAVRWAQDYLRDFTERELALLGLNADARGTRAMLAMLASVNGQPLNMNMIAKSIGMSGPTVKRYLHYFEQAFLVSVLPSYHMNLRKRLTSAPKVYLADTGLLHAQLRIADLESLRTGIMAGTSWEGFVVQQVRAWLQGRAELHYFRTHDGSELDLIITQSLKPKVAIEIKTTNSPALSKGNRLAFEAVNAPVQLILTPDAGDHPYSKGIEVCSLNTVWKHLERALGK